MDDIFSNEYLSNDDNSPVVMYARSSIGNFPEDDEAFMDGILTTRRVMISTTANYLQSEFKVVTKVEPQGGGMDKFIKASELKFKSLEVEASPQRSRLGRVFDFLPMSSQTREDLSFILDDIDEDVKDLKAKGTDSFTVNAVAGSRLVSALATLFWGALKGIFSRPLPSQSRDKSRTDE